MGVIIIIMVAIESFGLALFTFSISSLCSGRYCCWCSWFSWFSGCCLGLGLLVDDEEVCVTVVELQLSLDDEDEDEDEVEEDEEG